MANYKEIVTKTVIGKGKKSFTNKYSLDVSDNISTILGCWIINHKFNGILENNDVLVNGSFDVNIWYSYDNDSKTSVINKTINYNDLFNVKVKENADLSNNTDIIVRTLKQPTCSKVDINGNSITFNIEKELGVEIVGDTKVKIAIEDDEEPWDILEDDTIEEDLKKIDEIKEEYL